MEISLGIKIYSVEMNIIVLISMILYVYILHIAVRCSYLPDELTNNRAVSL